MNRPITFQAKHENIELALTEIGKQRHPISILLDGINDIRNIGAILRLADAARLKKIWLYNVAEHFSNRKLKRFSRSANEYVQLERLKSIDDLITLKHSHQFFALEITDQSIPYTQIEVSQPCILVVGNEQRGVSKEILALADRTIHLPMYGINLSMNVAMATGIATYHLLQTYLKTIPAENNKRV